MPYVRIDELPHTVRNILPSRAQEIYREAFNYVWQWCGHDESRAHRVAWSAVKAAFERHPDTNKWIARESEQAVAAGWN